MEITGSIGNERKAAESAQVQTTDVTLFNRAYDWMKARGMSEGQSQHAALVVG